jgi:hypothetical protein
MESGLILIAPLVFCAADRVGLNSVAMVSPADVVSGRRFTMESLRRPLYEGKRKDHRNRMDLV